MSLEVKEVSGQQVQTVYPYSVGQDLDLQDSTGFSFSATIVHEFTRAISPTFIVKIQGHGAVDPEAVLKLYDRRFSDLRKRRGADLKRRHQPHTVESEAAFQTLARDGSLAPVLDRLKHEDELYTIHHITPSPQDDQGKPEWEKLAEEEAEFFYKVQKRYINEVRAYVKLKDLQGCCIPRLFTTATLTIPSAPLDLGPMVSQVPGILIEKIDGFNLTDLVDEMPEGPTGLWRDIIQQAADVAVAINRAGVLDTDGQPRNAIVSRQQDKSYRVFRIDFGEASTEDDAEFNNEEEGPDFFKNCATSFDNPCQLAFVMVTKIKNLTGVELKIDMEEIWPGIQGIMPD